MRYDAITIDTTIFRMNGFQFGHGMLRQLEQFKNSSIDFVISEIVLKEIKRALCKQVEESKQELDKSIKQSSKIGALSPSTTRKLQKISNAIKSSEDIVSNLVQKFLKSTGAVTIPAALATTETLIDIYFNAKPPFRESGKKKNEFPDAIALLSIESWARSSKKKVLAISEDTDWANYVSEWIDFEKDLALSLKKIQQQHTEEAEKFIVWLLGELSSNRQSSALDVITETLIASLSDMQVLPEAIAAYEFETGRVDMRYEKFDFRKRNENFDFSIVQLGKNKLAAKVSILIKAKAICEFSFAVWDSVDKEYVGMGSRTVSTEVEFPSAILITIKSDHIATPQNYKLAEVELVDAIDSVDFGEVSANHEDDDYDHDLYDFHR